MSDIKLEHTLSSSYPKFKFISEMIGNVIGGIVIVVLFLLHHYFSWPQWAFWILIVLVVLTIAGIIWNFIEPKLLYRSWSYQFSEEYLQMSSGIFTKEWVTVPMTKIQSVSTVQGPLMKRFDLCSIKVETMGSSHTIPGLEHKVALELREIIAEYAKLKEVDD